MGACRPLFLSLGLPGVSIRVCCVVRASFRLAFVHRCMGFKRFWVVCVAFSLVFVAICMGFKALTCFLFDSTVLGEHDLQKHLVK